MINDTEKAALHRRLNKVIGQCNGLTRMINSDTPCTNILLQVSAAKNALHQLGQILLEDYVADCMATALKEGKTEANDRFIKEFNTALESFCRMRK